LHVIDIILPSLRHSLSLDHLTLSSP